MTREQVHDLMENELRCVQRGNYCDRDCAKCPLVKDDKELIEAYGYVIKALEQEPCEDAVSRKDVLDMLFWKRVDMGDALYERLDDIAKRLHPVQTLRDIEVELYREKVVDAFERGVLHGKNFASVQHSRPTGHWIDTGWKCKTDTDEILYGYGCSECGAISFFRKSENKILGGKWCHYCGARMESEGQA